MSSRFRKGEKMIDFNIEKRCRAHHCPDDGMIDCLEVDGEPFRSNSDRFAKRNSRTGEFDRQKKDECRHTSPHPTHCCKA